MARSPLSALAQVPPSRFRRGGRFCACWPIVLAVGAVVCSGCASLVTGEWAAEEAQLPLADPSPRLGVKTIPVEARWVRHPVDDPLAAEQLWASADEQALPRDVRERLAANGLRAGLVPWPLPTELAERLAYVAVEEASDTTEQPNIEDTLMPDVSRQTLRLLPGRHSEVVATPATPELVVMMRDNGRVYGTTYQHASAVFELTAEAAADGKTEVELLPVIKHGDRRREWVGEEGVFRLEAGQCSQHLDSLGVSLELADNAILVITAAGPPSSTVGDAFFRGRDLPRTPQQTLLIRPLTRTTDPLFAVSEAAQ